MACIKQREINLNDFGQGFWDIELIHHGRDKAYKKCLYIYIYPQHIRGKGMHGN